MAGSNKMDLLSFNTGVTPLIYSNLSLRRVTHVQVTMKGRILTEKSKACTGFNQSGIAKESFPEIRRLPECYYLLHVKVVM